MNDKTAEPFRWTRRAFIRCVPCAGAWLLTGCGDATAPALRDKAKRLGAVLECSDTSRLQRAEAATRDENAYRQHTEKSDQFCLSCLNYVPPDDEARCGTCKTVRGPINPDGWCKQWTKSRG